MNLQSLIHQFRIGFQGFQPAASDETLAKLQRACGVLPEQILAVYRDHDGFDPALAEEDTSLPVRLMPIAEVLDTRDQMTAYEKKLPMVGPVAWFWTDDNSNYAGVYLDGPLVGWVTVLNHEEPELTPAFRSVESFMSHMLANTLGNPKERAFDDIPSLRREYPKIAPDGAQAEQDWLLAELFIKQRQDEVDKELSRLFAICAICLTPFEKTSEVFVFFDADDMWIPEAAVRLLEVRRWREGVEQLERLAHDGYPNGDRAAMRLLSRMNTNQSRQAIMRLRQSLKDQKLKALEMWADRRMPLPPPRW
jgi:hypothetical protein